MKIGELAKLTGLATSRIRFYEASGLIRSQRSKPTATARGRHRVDPGAGHRRPGRRLLLEERSPAAERRRRLAARRLRAACVARWPRSEALQRRLEQNKAQLLVAIESIENKPDGLQCTENTRACWSACARRPLHRRSGVHGKTCSRASSPTPAEQRLSDA